MTAFLIAVLVVANVYTLRGLIIWRERAWRALGHAKQALYLNDTLIKERDRAVFDAEFEKTLRDVQSALLQRADD